MDNLIRTSVEENDKSIIKKQVMNRTDDNIIRHQVLGIEEVTPNIESLNVTENGTYEVEEGVDGFNPVVVNVPTGVEVTGATIVKSVPTVIAPEVLPEGHLYIVPNGEQYVPPFPIVSGCNYHFITCNDVTVLPQNWVDITRLNNSTKFWLFLSSSEGKCRRDAIQTVSWGSSTSDIMPDHIYEYDTTGTFEWSELDKTDPDVITNFSLAVDQPNAIIHNILECVYTNYNIFRYTVGNLEFDKSLSILNDEGRVYNVYNINEFKCYKVVEGVAVYNDTYTMKQLISYYS